MAGGAAACALATSGEAMSPTMPSTNAFFRILFLAVLILRSLRAGLSSGTSRVPESVHVAGSGADVVAVFNGEHEHAAIADLARARGPNDRFDDLVRHHHFDLDLRQQRDAVLLAPVHSRVPFLASMAAHVGDGHAGDVQLLERIADVIHLMRAQNALHEFHGFSF